LEFFASSSAISTNFFVKSGNEIPAVISTPGKNLSIKSLVSAFNTDGKPNSIISRISLTPLRWEAKIFHFDVGILFDSQNFLKEILYQPFLNDLQPPPIYGLFKVFKNL